MNVIYFTGQEERMVDPLHSFSNSKYDVGLGVDPDEGSFMIVNSVGTVTPECQLMIDDHGVVKFKPLPHDVSSYLNIINYRIRLGAHLDAEAATDIMRLLGFQIDRTRIETALTKLQ